MEIASFVKGMLECVCTPLLKELSYLCSYKDNIATLGVEEKKLSSSVRDVEVLVLVKTAEKHGSIKNQVQNWLERANEKVTEAQNLDKKVEELAKKNHRRFCACCCSPDWLSRYRLSKQAFSITTKTVEIYNERNNFDSVTLPPSSPKRTAPLPDSDFMSFESTENAMNYLSKALKDENIQIVGIHGMPGVGKTTLVKQVAIKVFTEGLFDGVGIATVKQTVNLKQIQGSIADGLEFKLEKETEDGRATELGGKIMADKRILIILDDLWDEIDLSSIGIPIGSKKACELKILLATRRQHVCHIMGCKENVIHLNVLSPRDSYKLFKKTAGPVLDSPKFKAVAEKIAQECQGLPLAIHTVAKALGDKELKEWENAAMRIERYSEYPDEEKLMKLIKMSYDFVKKPGAKKCFLMCSLFPEDHNINKEVLARYGMGLRLFKSVDTLDKARGYADTRVNDLIDSGLLLKGDKDGCVKMHDVIRDTAIWITSPDDADQSKTSPDDGDQPKTSPEKKQLFMARAGPGLKEFPRWLQDNGFDSYNAVSVMFNDMPTLPDEPVSPKLEILLLQKNSNLMEIPSDFFKRMNTLKVLDVSELEVLSLPTSIGLLQNLCTLHMDRCKSKDISILGGLKSLEILSLKESLIDTFPEELAELSRLRLLDMTSCKHIKTISPKIISRLHRLEELYLQGSFCKWGDRVKGTSEKINASLEEVINLRLTILKVDIEDVNCFPRTVEATPKWEKFDICIGGDEISRLTNVSTSRLKRAHTRTLFIDTTMSTLPDWFFEAVTKKAEMLIYSDCKDTMDILTAYDKGRLFDLKSLYVEQCHKVQCLIPLKDGIPNNPIFAELQELHIHHMESLKEIWVGQLPPQSFEKLKFLEVKQCSYLENSLLRSNIIQRLHNLEKLLVTGNSITEVFGFEGLQEGLRYLPTLKKLRLDNLSKLTNIWKGPAQLADFSNVKTVFVNQCDKLRYLFSPSMTQGLLQLEVLWVEDCPNLDEIIQKDGGISLDKITLPQLETLALVNLENLVNFYDGNSYLECLKYLHVRNCPNYRTSNFHSSGQVKYDDESHYKLLKKRLNEPEDISIALE